MSDGVCVNDELKALQSWLDNVTLDKNFTQHVAWWMISEEFYFWIYPKNVAILSVHILERLLIQKVSRFYYLITCCTYGAALDKVFPAPSLSVCGVFCSVYWSLKTLYLILCSSYALVCELYDPFFNNVDFSIIASGSVFLNSSAISLFFSFSCCCCLSISHLSDNTEVE